jgi:O-methyltransferase
LYRWIISMSKMESLTSLLNLGNIDFRLMLLAWQLKRTQRTYLSYAKLLSLARNIQLVHTSRKQPLQVAEFGVGRGGSATLLAWMVNKYGGKLALYDLFGLIPAPSSMDGKQAQDRYEKIIHQEGIDYYGKIDNLLELVLKDIHRVCPAEAVEVIQGKYEDVLPGLKDGRVFSFVHIDCDWFDSSMAVYRYLQHRLCAGAIMQIDDYSKWEGSKRAFNDAGWPGEYRTHMVDEALVVDTSEKLGRRIT